MSLPYWWWTFEKFLFTDFHIQLNILHLLQQIILEILQARKPASVGASVLSWLGCMYSSQVRWGTGALAGHRIYLWVLLCKNYLVLYIHIGYLGNVTTAARNELDSPRIESRWWWDFLCRPERPQVLPNSLCNEYQVFPGGKAVGALHWPPTSF
jgi:hypothetical protein